MRGSKHPGTTMQADVDGAACFSLFELPIYIMLQIQAKESKLKASTDQRKASTDHDP